MLSPISFRDVEWAARRFHLGLTVEKVKHSPSIDTDEPVSRQHERAYSRYSGYPMYGGLGCLGSSDRYQQLVVGQASAGIARLDRCRQLGGSESPCRHVAMSRHAVKNSPEWDGSGGK